MDDFRRFRLLSGGEEEAGSCSGTDTADASLYRRSISYVN